jgi:hypothetical protein
MDAPRPVVVTPYYKEHRSFLERCIESVRRQTIRTDHLLVADGFPQDWIDSVGVRHLRLDRAHGDFGNTPRGVGSVLAASEGCLAISMIDADNWIEPNHFEECLGAARSLAGRECDFVVARRNLMRPDGTRIDIAEEPGSEHVDTNCMVFLRGAYHLLASWALMPKQISSVGDRIMWSTLKARGLLGVIAGRPTVNYHCIWESVYRAIGELPPAGAKPNIDSTPVAVYLRGLNDRDLEIASRLSGSQLSRLP